MSRKANHENPLYKRIYNDLAARIKQGNIEKLSSVSIGKTYSVNRNTADKIISLLETNGWVRRIPRKGTFPVKKNLQKINSINIVYCFNSFNEHFLNRYPFVNAKLIESIYQSELAKQCNINIMLIDPTSTYAQILEKLTAMGPRAGFAILDSQQFPLGIDILRQEKIPYMTFGPEVFDLNRVSHDSYRGTYRAIEHLIKVSGRRHIAFLNSSSDPKNNPWLYARYQAYTDALEHNGIPFREEYIITESTLEGITGLVSSLKKNRKIDAIFASSFEIGRKIVDALKLSEIKIPEDIAVIVFYDLPEFSQTNPGITVVRAPLEKMGAAIIENLLDMINFGFRDDIRLTFNDELVLRDSC